MNEAIDQQPEPARRVFLFGQSEQASNDNAEPVTDERWDRVRDALEGKPFVATDELVRDLLLEFQAQERFRVTLTMEVMGALNVFRQHASVASASHEATFRAHEAFTAGRQAGIYESYASAAARLTDVLNKAAGEAQRR